MHLSQKEALQLIRALFAEARHREARSLCHAILRDEPTHTEALDLLADALMNCGEHAEALSVLATARALEPGLPKHQHRTGECLLAAGQASAAQPYFAAALRLASGHPGSRARLACCLFLQGQLEQALQHCRQVPEGDPHAFTAQQISGNCLAQLGMADAAVRHWERCVELAPAHVAVRHDLAATLVQLGRLAEAAHHFETALLCDPANLAVMRALAETLLLLGRHADADGYLERLIVLDSADATLHLLRGQALERLERHGEALALYSEAARTDGCAREAFYLMMLTLRKLGRFEAALRCCRQVLAYGDDYRGTLLHEAQLLAITDNTAAWESFARHAEQTLTRAGGTALAVLTPELLAAFRHQPCGPRLLVHSTGNYGDDLFFLQWLPTLLQGCNATAVFVCPPLLRTVVAQLDGVETIDATEQVPPALDCQLALFALPWLCSQLGASGSRADRQACFAATFGGFATAQSKGSGKPGTGALRIGIAWHGSPAFEGAATPALSPEVFATLLDGFDAELLTLQWGHAQWNTQADTLPVIDAAAGCRDYRELAGVLAEVDAVVACDSAVAHVAALLGKPVLLLHSGQAGWLWCREQEDSSGGAEPGHPPVTLFDLRDAATPGSIRAALAALHPRPFSVAPHRQDCHANR